MFKVEKWENNYDKVTQKVETSLLSSNYVKNAKITELWIKKKKEKKKKKNGKEDIFIETTRNIAYVFSRTCAMYI